MKKLAALILAVVLMLTLTACGGSDWRDTVKEYEGVVDKYLDLAKDAISNPTDTNIQTEVEKVNGEIEEWNKKLEEISEELEGTDEEKEFEEELTRIGLKLLGDLNDSGVMDELENQLGDIEDQLGDIEDQLGDMELDLGDLGDLGDEF